MSNLPPLKCDVCGQPAVGVASSTLGAISFAFCKRCLAESAEPYGMLVSTCAICGDIREMTQYVQDMIPRTLSIVGKTMDEFLADVEKAKKELDEYCLLEGELE